MLGHCSTILSMFLDDLVKVSLRSVLVTIQTVWYRYAFKIRLDFVVKPLCFIKKPKCYMGNHKETLVI